MAPATVAPQDPRTTLSALQASDLRLAAVAHRLASSGSDLCPRTALLTGITLHHASQYASALREAAREVFGLDDGIGVLAVAPGSAADAAGVKARDMLLSIGERPIAATAPTGRARYDAVAGAYGLLEAAAATGRVVLTLRRGDAEMSVDVTPVRGCASRVQLRTDPTVYAGAGGVVLSVTTGLLSYVENDDELALVVAHEMAHNALGHRETLAAHSVRPSAAAIRATEAAADRLGYVLMARAGYDLGVAEGFWRRLYSGPAKGRANAATHRDLDARMADARAATAEWKRKDARTLPR